MSSKTKYRLEADKEFNKKYQKERCEICGKVDVTPVHHFFRKGQYPHLRYEPDNAITLCNQCHYEIDHGKNTLAFKFKVIWYRGLDWYFWLRKQAEKDMGSGWENVEWYKKQYNKLKNG